MVPTLAPLPSPVYRSVPVRIEQHGSQMSWNGQAASVSHQRRFVGFITRLPGFEIIMDPTGCHVQIIMAPSNSPDNLLGFSCSSFKPPLQYLLPTELPSFWLLRVLVLGRGAATLSAIAFPAEPRSSLSLLRPSPRHISNSGH